MLGARYFRLYMKALESFFFSRCPAKATMPMLHYLIGESESVATFFFFCHAEVLFRSGTKLFSCSMFYPQLLRLRASDASFDRICEVERARRKKKNASRCCRYSHCTGELCSCISQCCRFSVEDGAAPVPPSSRDPSSTLSRVRDVTAESARVVLLHTA